MPHDVKSRLLQVGDPVMIPGVITALSPSADYCNCSVELEHLMLPEKTKTVISSINTRQLIRANHVDRQENSQEAEASDQRRADQLARSKGLVQHSAVDSQGRPIDVHGNVLPLKEGVE
jgi:hypothetical protein